MGKKQNILLPDLTFLDEEKVEETVPTEEPAVEDPQVEQAALPDLGFLEEETQEEPEVELEQDIVEQADDSPWEKVRNSIENTWGQLKGARWDISQALNIPLSYGDKGITWLADKAGLDPEKTEWLRKKWAANTAMSPSDLGILSRFAPSGMETGMKALEAAFLDKDERAEVFQERTFPEEQARIAEKQQEAVGEMKEGGSIIEGIKNGDPGEIAAGVVDGTLGFVPSLVVGISTGGTGFVPWVVGTEMNRSVQTESQLTDKGLAELFEQGDANVGTSLLVGVSTGLLERYGFGKLSKYLKNKEIGSTFANKFKTLMTETGRQGLINWVEAGLSKYADTYTELDAGETREGVVPKVENQYKAAKEAANWMFTDEGYDAALKAMAGSMVMGGGKHIGRSFAPKKNAKLQKVEIAPGKTSTMIETESGSMVLTYKSDKKSAESIKNHLDELYPNSEFEVVPVVDKQGDFVEGKFTVEQKSAVETADVITAEEVETARQNYNDKFDELAKETDPKKQEKLKEEADELMDVYKDLNQSLGKPRESLERKRIIKEEEKKLAETEKKIEEEAEKVPETKKEVVETEETKPDVREQKLTKKETEAEVESQKKETEAKEELPKKELRTEEEINKEIDDVEKDIEHLKEESKNDVLELNASEKSQETKNELYREHRAKFKADKEALEERRNKLINELKTTKDARKTEEKTEERVQEERPEGKRAEQGRVRDDKQDRKSTKTQKDVDKLVEELPDDARGKITSKGIKSKFEKGRKAIDKKLKDAKRKLADEFVGTTEKVKKIKPGLENIKNSLYKIAPRKAVDEIVKETYERKVKGIDESGYRIQADRDGKSTPFLVKFLPGGKTVVTEITDKGFKNKNVPKGPLHNKLVDQASSQRSSLFQRLFDEQVTKLEEELYDQLYDEIADYRTGRHKDVPAPAKKGKFPDQPRKKTKTSKQPTKKERMPSFGTKVTVDEMAAYKEQVRKEIKDRKLGAKEANKVKSEFIDMLKGLLRDSDIKQMHGRQVGALIGKIRKVKQDNVLDVLNEAIEYVEKMEGSKKKKAAETKLKDLLKTKTQKVDTQKKTKKGWQGTQRKKYFLDAANIYYDKFQSYKSGVAKVLKTIPRNANEQQRKNIKAENERIMLKEHRNMMEWFEKELADIDQRLMDDDVVVVEKAMAEKAAYETMAYLWAVNKEGALTDVNSIWENTTDDLNYINNEITRILAGEKSKLATKIEAETRRRNVFKQMARKQSEGRYAGMTKAQILQARKGTDVNQFNQFFKDRRINARNWFNKNINSPITASFDLAIKKIEARQSLVGQGPLYEALMKGPRGWLDAKKNLYDRRKDFREQVERGEERIFGKKLTDYQKFKYGKEVADTGIYPLMPNGERSQQPMAPAQAMYVYALSQMAPVRQKLAEQGWDKTTLEQVEAFLGEKNIQYVELFTKEIFPQRWKDYNRHHIEEFSTPLDKINNFMPLTYDQMGTLQGEGDLSIGGTKFMMPSTMSKHLKYRTENTHPLNTMGNFFAIANSYTQSMERWYNYSRFVSDANILLSDAQTRANIETQNPGMGKLLAEALNRAAGVNTDAYTSTAFLHEVNRGVALAQIGFKLWTAAKQIISVLAWGEKTYRPEIKVGDRRLYVPLLGSLKFISKMAFNVTAMRRNHKFFMKNSTFYRERVEQGTVGDEQLLRMLMSVSKPTTTALGFRYKQLQKGVVKTALKPNKVVDQLAISMGGKVFYDEQYKNYKKTGMSNAEAHRLAIRDFDLEFNLAQQSSEEAFLGPMQSDPGIVKSVMATFKNAQMAYYRKNAEAIMDGANEYRRARDRAYQSLIDQGMSSEKAHRKARRKGLKGLKTKATGDAIKKAAIYGSLLPLAWQFFQSGLPGLVTDKTDEDEDEMNRSLLFGMIDGLVLYADIGKYIYDLRKMDKVYAPDFGLLAAKELVDVIQDLSKAYDENGEFNMVVGKEVVKMMMLYGLKVDMENLPVIYEGFEEMILNGNYTKENALKLMKAPNTMIEEVKDDPYAKRKRALQKRKKDSPYEKRKQKMKSKRSSIYEERAKRLKK